MATYDGDQAKSVISYILFLSANAKLGQTLRDTGWQRPVEPELGSFGGADYHRGGMSQPEISQAGQAGKECAQAPLRQPGLQ